MHVDGIKKDENLILINAILIGGLGSLNDLVAVICDNYKALRMKVNLIDKDIIVESSYENVQVKILENYDKILHSEGLKVQRSIILEVQN